MTAIKDWLIHWVERILWVLLLPLAFLYLMYLHLFAS